MRTEQLKCRKCGKIINPSRQHYKHIGKYTFDYTKGYVYEAYEHIDCKAKLLPTRKPLSSKMLKNLCKELDKII